jgi:hypothetical protein
VSEQAIIETMKRIFFLVLGKVVFRGKSNFGGGGEIAA